MLPPFATTTDAETYGYQVSDALLARASARIRSYLKSAHQPLIIPSPPDALIELTCRIAERLQGTHESVASGIVQDTQGPFSQSFGMDAWRGLSGLTLEEKQVLRGLFPPIPHTILTNPYPDGMNKC
ncbi:MAG: hypothetical protein LBJ43_00535 [Propionibacteriaceae bacterium]|jgi:hypothetical protein|nr:hypothetical protein [Propionibacteriaceae bacterium]